MRHRLMEVWLNAPAEPTRRQRALVTAVMVVGGLLLAMAGK